MRAFIIVLLSGFAAFDSVSGQPSNETAYQRLAIACIGDLPDSEPAIELTAPQKMPFVRSALITHWSEQGYRVFWADSLVSDVPEGLSRFSYRIDEAAVTYRRLKKKRINRTVDLSIAATLLTPAGEVLRDDTCRRQYADTLAVADLNAVESSTYPETQAPHPQPGWIRRIVEPVMLTTATVVGVYLFFALRSDSSDDGN